MGAFVSSSLGVHKTRACDAPDPFVNAELISYYDGTAISHTTHPRRLSPVSAYFTP